MSLDTLNTSNRRIRDLIIGASKEKCLPAGNYFLVDVRHLALAQESASLLCRAHSPTSTDMIRKAFPPFQYRLLPRDALKPSDYPEGSVYEFDNSRSREVLGLNFRPVEESIVDAVESLRRHGVERLLFTRDL